jgi:hypothetical protein
MAEHLDATDQAARRAIVWRRNRIKGTVHAAVGRAQGGGCFQTDNIVDTGERAAALRNSRR